MQKLRRRCVVCNDSCQKKETSSTPHIFEIFLMQMLEYLKTCHGFQDKNVTLLLDDGKHTSPTASNIMNAFAKIAAESQAGDVVFIHYRFVP